MLSSRILTHYEERLRFGFAASESYLSSLTNVIAKARARRSQLMFNATAGSIADKIPPTPPNSHMIAKTALKL